MGKKLIIFIDSGDTLVDESTEIRDKNSIVQSADLIEGAHEAITELFEDGYTMVLVADGKEESFVNMYTQKKLFHMM